MIYSNVNFVRKVTSLACMTTLAPQPATTGDVEEDGKTATLRLSGGCHPTERSWMEVGRVLGSFILRSAQQEEALHRICKPLEPLLATTPDCASDPLAGPHYIINLEV
ncbi:unnamed protein product [Spirodela intermedia]|uniref:Uncharacterized protein n=1 Tax=Spirodela intermedia TaxID=51605 RepID=A0ABN7E970_SPIIN|nr:unnamed protein product [Spirodela intermedia]